MLNQPSQLLTWKAVLFQSWTVRGILYFHPAPIRSNECNHEIRPTYVLDQRRHIDSLFFMTFHSVGPISIIILTLMEVDVWSRFPAGWLLNEEACDTGLTFSKWILDTPGEKQNPEKDSADELSTPIVLDLSVPLVAVLDEEFSRLITSTSFSPVRYFSSYLEK